MTFKKEYLLFHLIFLCSVVTFGQTNPPPVAVPSDSTIALIDKIIEVTKHESYFIEYCSKKVKNYAQENNWSPGKTNKVLGSIKFKYYSSTIYNSYGFYSVAHLKKLVEAMAGLNNERKNYQTMILTNSMMQDNLDLFVESVIEGKYITSN